MNEAQMNAAISEALALMNMHAQRNLKLAVDLATVRAELDALKASMAAPANK